MFKKIHKEKRRKEILEMKEKGRFQPSNQIFVEKIDEYYTEHVQTIDTKDFENLRENLRELAEIGSIDSNGVGLIDIIKLPRCCFVFH
ncbi:hypothetical protein [Mycoplasmoides pneumoniae]|uniref:Uncharacterized protein n=2 Tax=Mycoplasmoides pneumoniae TaxID=2104 RepID=A0A0H3DLB1_MYCPB|nr:hypothetical protein [Mycoplasmoides pneumoniae]ADK87175.1 hypothetical protein MPNE_0600 [Mycoplasmoides pneumoniae FH]GLL57680.1 hypothetical protein KPI25BX_4420 [Mycoplasmoides pneumoniae]GLL58975.1 hypothetical protein Y12242BV_2990 [Mycoplasmoides pneumoniae]GLL59740.1 hypothetical protein Y12382J_3460 [Mycoplasmoides pneumoniae]